MLLWCPAAAPASVSHRHGPNPGRSQPGQWYRRILKATSWQGEAARLCSSHFLYRDVLEQDLPWLDDVVRSKRPARLPVVLTKDEVGAVLQRMNGVPRLMAILLYGAGLRLLECAHLRVKDMDLARNQITVRAGKGDRDRVTMLPATLRAPLSEHLEAVKRQHERDLQHGAGWAELPGALARKCPNAGREWPWQWVFPAIPIYVDRVTGQRRRHHPSAVRVSRLAAPGADGNVLFFRSRAAPVAAETPLRLQSHPCYVVPQTSR